MRCIHMCMQANKGLDYVSDPLFGTLVRLLDYWHLERLGCCADPVGSRMLFYIIPLSPMPCMPSWDLRQGSSLQHPASALPMRGCSLPEQANATRAKFLMPTIDDFQLAGCVADDYTMAYYCPTNWEPFAQGERCACMGTRGLHGLCTHGCIYPAHWELFAQKVWGLCVRGVHLSTPPRPLLCWTLRPAHPLIDPSVLLTSCLQLLWATRPCSSMCPLST